MFKTKKILAEYDTLLKSLSTKMDFNADIFKLRVLSLVEFSLGPNCPEFLQLSNKKFDQIRLENVTEEERKTREKIYFSKFIETCVIKIQREGLYKKHTQKILGVFTQEYLIAIIAALVVFSFLFGNYLGVRGFIIFNKQWYEVLDQSKATQNQFKKDSLKSKTIDIKN